MWVWRHENWISTIFGRSVHPIPGKGAGYTPHYTECPLQIFRPSYGPVDSSPCHANFLLTFFLPPYIKWLYLLTLLLSTMVSTIPYNEWQLGLLGSTLSSNLANANLISRSYDCLLIYFFTSIIVWPCK